MTPSLRPLHQLFAAVAHGVTLTSDLNDADTAAIREGVGREAVVVLPGSRLSPDEQTAFASRFGTLEPQNGMLTAGVAARVTPRLVDISNIDENDALHGRNDRRRMFALGDQLWHTDSSFKRTPASYSMLRLAEESNSYRTADSSRR
jgi:alpha-ketoglutarate-dependent 2,4-dichlorophenoxyacetate dioxygenase